jgi:hypothetical protein
MSKVSGTFEAPGGASPSMSQAWATVLGDRAGRLSPARLEELDAALRLVLAL